MPNKVRVAYVQVIPNKRRLFKKGFCSFNHWRHARRWGCRGGGRRAAAHLPTPSGQHRALPRRPCPVGPAPSRACTAPLRASLAYFSGSPVMDEDG